MADGRATQLQLSFLMLCNSLPTLNLQVYVSHNLVTPNAPPTHMTLVPTVLCHVKQQQHSQDEQQVAAVPHEHRVPRVAGEDADDNVLQPGNHQDNGLLAGGSKEQHRWCSSKGLPGTLQIDKRHPFARASRGTHDGHPEWRHCDDCGQRRQLGQRCAPCPKPIAHTVRHV